MSNLLCVDTFFLYSHQISNEAGRFSPVYIIIDYKFYLMFCISTFCVHMLGLSVAGNASVPSWER